MNDTILIIIILAAILVMVLLVMFLVNMRHQQTLKDLMGRFDQQSSHDVQRLKTEISAELMKFQQQMSRSLNEDLHRLNEATTSRLLQMEQQMNQGLMESMKSTHASFTTMKEQLVKIDQSQNQLKDLSTNIAQLQNVLTDKKTRGIYGEVELYTLLENTFGVQHQQYQTQYKLSNGNIADVVLLANPALGKIVIDSKFPLENYNRMYDESSKTEKLKARQEFKKDVTKHLKDIHQRYLSADETAEFAYMFVPAEAVFAEIYGRFEDVVNLSYQLKVYIVSPTTLMAYITALKAISLGQQRDKNVALIQQEFVKLGQDFSRFSDRFDQIVRDFEKSYRNLNLVQTSADKIINRFHRIEAVDLVSTNQEILEEEKDVEEI